MLKASVKSKNKYSDKETTPVSNKKKFDLNKFFELF